MPLKRTNTLAGMLAAVAVVLPISVLAQHEHMNMSSKPAKDSFAAAMDKSMKLMDRDMMAAPMTGDPDHDFATMMIPHHQGARDRSDAPPT